MENRTPTEPESDECDASGRRVAETAEAVREDFAKLQTTRKDGGVVGDEGF